MKHYKKRTIALCLASVLTVVGAFGADNYSNSLMELQVNNGSNGFVSMTAATKQPLKKPLQVSRLDNNTFIIMLPDTNNQATVPNIVNFNNIESIEILTLPYTPETNGYTKVILKTHLYLKFQGAA